MTAAIIHQLVMRRRAAVAQASAKALEHDQIVAQAKVDKDDPDEGYRRIARAIHSLILEVTKPEEES